MNRQVMVHNAPTPLEFGDVMQPGTQADREDVLLVPEMTFEELDHIKNVEIPRNPDGTPKNEYKETYNFLDHVQNRDEDLLPPYEDMEW